MAEIIDFVKDGTLRDHLEKMPKDRALLDDETELFWVISNDRPIPFSYDWALSGGKP